MHKTPPRARGIVILERKSTQARNAKQWGEKKEETFAATAANMSAASMSVGQKQDLFNESQHHHYHHPTRLWQWAEFIACIIGCFHEITQ